MLLAAEVPRHLLERNPFAICHTPHCLFVCLFVCLCFRFANLFMYPVKEDDAPGYADVILR